MLKNSWNSNLCYGFMAPFLFVSFVFSLISSSLTCYQDNKTFLPQLTSCVQNSVNRFDKTENGKMRIDKSKYNNMKVFVCNENVRNFVALRHTRKRKVIKLKERRNGGCVFLLFFFCHFCSGWSFFLEFFLSNWQEAIDAYLLHLFRKSYSLQEYKKCFHMRINVNPYLNKNWRVSIALSTTEWLCSFKSIHIVHCLFCVGFSLCEFASKRKISPSKTNDYGLLEHFVYICIFHWLFLFSLRVEKRKKK